jgi:hypothetical protein
MGYPITDASQGHFIAQIYPDSEAPIGASTADTDQRPVLPKIRACAGGSKRK